MKHVGLEHDIEEYYSIHLRDDLNGYCVKCGNESPFKIGIRKNGVPYYDGFHRYCRECSDYVSCEECQREFPDNASLMTHVSKQHDSILYHDKYLRTKSSGYCSICSSPTPVQINTRNGKKSFQGFKKFCSDGCHKKGRSEWVSRSTTEMWKNPEYALKMSILASERVMDPTNDFGMVEGWGYDTVRKRRRKTKFNNQPTYDKNFGIKFRSKFEWRVAKRLEKANVKWQFEPKVTLPGNAYCYPDFYLPEHELFIELRPAKMVDDKLISKIRTIKNTYEKEVVLCTNLQGAITFIERLDEEKPKVDPEVVWIFEDKRGEKKSLRELKG